MAEATINSSYTVFLNSVANYKSTVIIMITTVLISGSQATLMKRRKIIN